MHACMHARIHTEIQMCIYIQHRCYKNISGDRFTKCPYFNFMYVLYSGEPAPVDVSAGGSSNTDMLEGDDKGQDAAGNI